ncbi:MAG: hypothetical protein R3C16_01490 [Hyphomonadaceae bacterium]
MLGAAESTNGFALAVSDDGKVAIAGSVEGALNGASAEKGGTDSFVTLFDANGKELWTQRRGASADDEVRAIAFAPNGSVIVAGKTDSALGPALALGGADAYVRGYSANGAELFTRQFGTGGADSATALAVRDDGAGGIEIFTGGVENNRGVVRSFSYSTTAGFVAGATRDLGNFYKGELNAIALDNGALYVGGAIGADRLTLGTTARNAVAGQEGFVARLDVDLISTTLDRASYLGSAADDAVTGVAIVNGQVYASGKAGGLIAGVGNAKASSGFLARLDDAGALGWVRTFSSAGGPLKTVSSLAVDQSGASALDILGLPRGELATSTAAPLTARSALRVGDEFRIGVDGRRLVTLRIGATETLSTLVTSINRAIGGAGRAEIVREDGLERVKISARAGSAVRIEPGREGRDALGGLGLSQGIIAANSGAGGLKTFGLGLVAGDLKLDSAAAIKATKAELSAAISLVRQAYETLLNPNAAADGGGEGARSAASGRGCRAAILLHDAARQLPPR